MHKQDATGAVADVCPRNDIACQRLMAAPCLPRLAFHRLSRPRPSDLRRPRITGAATARLSTRRQRGARKQRVCVQRTSAGHVMRKPRRMREHALLKVTRSVLARADKSQSFAFYQRHASSTFMSKAMRNSVHACCPRDVIRHASSVHAGAQTCALYRITANSHRSLFCC